MRKNLNIDKDHASSLRVRNKVNQYWQRGTKYRADGVDGPPEMERSSAAARNSWARQHAWL